MADSERKQRLLDKFQNKLDVKVREEELDYHDAFTKMEILELGEEIRDDVWTIVKVPNGWIVKRLNFGAVFVPDTSTG